MDLSTRNLEQALSIRRQIDALQRRLNNLVGGGQAGPRVATSRQRGTGRRKLSAGARAKIAAAARARWARFRAGRGKGKSAKKAKRGGGITAAGRKRLSQLMKARWAARRKAKKR